jgi:hypothetical protein
MSEHEKHVLQTGSVFLQVCIHFQLDKNQFVYFYSPAEEFVQCRASVTYRVDFASPLTMPSQFCLSLALHRPVEVDNFPKWKRCNPNAGDTSMEIEVLDPYYQANKTYGYLENSPNGTLVAFKISRASHMVAPGEWGAISAIQGQTPDTTLLQVHLGYKGFRYADSANNKPGKYTLVESFTPGKPVGTWKKLWQEQVTVFHTYTDTKISPIFPYHQVHVTNAEISSTCENSGGRRCNEWAFYNESSGFLDFDHVEQDSGATIRSPPWFTYDGSVVRCYYSYELDYCLPFCKKYSIETTCCVHADKDQIYFGHSVSASYTYRRYELCKLERRYFRYQGNCLLWPNFILSPK